MRKASNHSISLPDTAWLAQLWGRGQRCRPFPPRRRPTSATARPTRRGLPRPPSATAYDLSRGGRHEARPGSAARLVGSIFLRRVSSLCTKPGSLKSRTGLKTCLKDRRRFAKLYSTAASAPISAQRMTKPFSAPLQSR